jgi:hypothetical protein
MPTKKVVAQTQQQSLLKKKDWITDFGPLPDYLANKEIARLVISELDHRAQYLKSMQKVIQDQRKIVAKQYAKR